MGVRIFKKAWTAKKGVNNKFFIRLLNTDITGYQFRTDLKYNSKDASPISTLTNGSGFEIADGPTGLLEINFSAPILSAVLIPDSEIDFPFINTLFDIEYNDGVGSPTEWEALGIGVLRVYEGVTNSNG